MTELQSRGWKFTSFVLGAALPVLAVAFLMKGNHERIVRKGEVDKAHDVTVEDSFPASDPPSAW